MKIIRIVNLNVFLPLTIVLLPCLVSGEVLQFPATGVWNGFLRHSNVVECVNNGAEAGDFSLEVRGNNGARIGQVVNFTIPENGTKHLIINAPQTVSAYGTYLLRRRRGALSRLTCHTAIYRMAASGSDTAVEHAFVLPVRNGLTGPSAGIYNSMNPGLETQPIYNWLTVYNRGGSVFRGRVDVYRANGTLDSARSFRIEDLDPGERIDFALGHNVGQVVGLYRLVPDNNSQVYGAFLTRYGVRGAEYNFAFPLEAEAGSCESVVLPISTMDPATNWGEIANASNRNVRVTYELRGVSGQLLLRQTRTLAPYTQYHVYINQYLGSRAVGTFRVRCPDGLSSGRLLVESLFYGHSSTTTPIVSWAYATQALGADTVSTEPVVLPLNTFMGASNWGKIIDESLRTSTVLAGIYDSAGLTVPTPVGSDGYLLRAGGTVDIPYHEDAGANFYGASLLSSNNRSARFRTELIRVFPRTGGGIGYIMNIPGGVFVPDSSGDQDSCRSGQGQNCLAMHSSSRTSGVLPLAVFFDAVGLNRATGVFQPTDGDRAQLHYDWDFDDPGSGTWSTTGKSKNVAIGYVAGHVFETPGSYEVTLRVQERNGTVRYYVENITVTDAAIVYGSSTRCISAIGNFTGCPAEVPAGNRITSSDYTTHVNWLLASNGPRRILFRRGETFSAAATPFFANKSGPFEIGAFGAGAKPIISSSGEILDIDVSTRDLRIVGLDLRGSRMAPAITPGTETLLYDNDISNFLNGITSSRYNVNGSLMPQNHALGFVADNVFSENAQYGIYYNLGGQVAIIGNIIDKPLGSNEHNIRCYLSHSLLEHNIFRGGSSQKHQLKFSGYFPTGHPDRSPQSPTEELEYTIISDNIFEEVPSGMNWVTGIGVVDATKDQRVVNSIFERNIVNAGPDTSAGVIIWARTVTLRNNVFDMTASNRGVSAINITRRGVEPPPLDNYVYNNSGYSGDAGSFSLVTVGSQASNTTIRNNMALAPLSSAANLISNSGINTVSSNNLGYFPADASACVDQNGATTCQNPDVLSVDINNANFLCPMAASPLVDSGSNLSSAQEDIDNQTRPRDGPDGDSTSEWDIGACEF